MDLDVRRFMSEAPRIVATELEAARQPDADA